MCSRMCIQGYMCLLLLMRKQRKKRKERVKRRSMYSWWQVVEMFGGLNALSLSLSLSLSFFLSLSLPPSLPLFLSPSFPPSLSYHRYGQMTAGSYCYIGPQGIVHGTTVSNCTPHLHVAVMILQYPPTQTRFSRFSWLCWMPVASISLWMPWLVKCSSPLVLVGWVEPRPRQPSSPGV